jgi:hypothetical protein
VITGSHGITASVPFVHNNWNLTINIATTKLIDPMGKADEDVFRSEICCSFKVATT